MSLFSDENTLLYQKSKSGFGKSSGEVVTKKVVKVIAPIKTFLVFMGALVMLCFSLIFLIQQETFQHFA